jgi:hypothetical protein
MKERMTLEKLAKMMKAGFEHLENSLRAEISEVRLNVGELQDGQKRMENDILDIKLRLDNTAHKFGVRQHDVRLTKIEKKLGLRQ